MTLYDSAVDVLETLYGRQVVIVGVITESGGSVEKIVADRAFSVDISCIEPQVVWRVMATIDAMPPIQCRFCTFTMECCDLWP